MVERYTVRVIVERVEVSIADGEIQEHEVLDTLQDALIGVYQTEEEAFEMLEAIA